MGPPPACQPLLPRHPRRLPRLGRWRCRPGAGRQHPIRRCRLAMAAMDKCLRAAGAGPEHVVKVQVFMTDITERPKINPRRIAYFGDDRPAFTLVEVKGLVDPRMKVEMECQAYVD
jgi:enamine deaminase RidA (YjgF/YER057c/UK114 family)